jgi:cytochrome c-type biogenesis protein CcmH
MITFSIAAALLVAAALLFVLPPLLARETAARTHVRRDELNLAVLRDQSRELDEDFSAGLIDKPAYEVARTELERRVVEEVRPADAASTAADKRWTAAAVGLLVPLVAVALYLYLGTPAALDPKQAVAAGDNAHEVSPEQIEGMVAALAQKLKDKPDKVEGWIMLARSYNALGRYAEASKAYERLAGLMPNNADLLADYADTLAMATNRSLQGEPEKIIDRALKIDPNNIKAIALSGSAAFERRDYAAAVTRWQKILTLVPADSDIAKSTSNSIAEAQGLSGQAPTAGAQTGAQAAEPAPAAQATAAAAAATAASARIEGTVELDPALRAQAADTDTVFIFARAAEGPRFPLAVLRKQVKDLPLKFTLDDSMSMMPNAKLSNFAQVIVGARISRSGSATPAAGDLEGVTDAVAPNAANLKIRIATRHN